MYYDRRYVLYHDHKPLHIDTTSDSQPKEDLLSATGLNVIINLYMRNNLVSSKVVNKIEFDDLPSGTNLIKLIESYRSACETMICCQYKLYHGVPQHMDITKHLIVNELSDQEDHNLFYGYIIYLDPELDKAEDYGKYVIRFVKTNYTRQERR